MWAPHRVTTDPRGTSARIRKKCPSAQVDACPTTAQPGEKSIGQVLAPIYLLASWPCTMHNLPTCAEQPSWTDYREYTHQRGLMNPQVLTPHFRSENVETQKGRVIYPRSHLNLGADPRPKMQMS